MKITCYRPSLIGFTLMEMLIVITIIAALSSVGMIVFNQAGDRVKYKKAETQVALIGAALDSYKLDYGYYPVSNSAAANSVPLFQELGGYDTTGAIDNTKENYLDMIDPNNSAKMVDANNNVIDPWGNPFHYLDAASNTTTNNPDFDLWSTGKDGNDDNGTGDDIKNW